MNTFQTLGSLALNSAKFVGSGVNDIYQGEYRRGLTKLAIGAAASAAAVALVYFNTGSNHDPFKLDQRQDRPGLPLCAPNTIRNDEAIVQGYRLAREHNLNDYIPLNNGIKSFTSGNHQRVEVFLGLGTSKVLNNFGKWFSYVDMPQYGCSLERVVTPLFG